MMNSPHKKWKSAPELNKPNAVCQLWNCAVNHILEKPCSQSVIQVDQHSTQSKSLNLNRVMARKTVIIIWLDYKLATTG